MALSLGVKRGTRILIGGKLFVVKEVVNKNTVRALFDGAPFVITDLERVELATDVYVSCGKSDRAMSEQYTRLAFEAPRAIKINRV